MARRNRNVGRMRHRLTIMQTVRVEDEGGGSARADVVLATVWARLEIASAREQTAYSSNQERVTHMAMIRYRADVENGQTVVILPPGATEPEEGSEGAPAGTALYVLTATDADPDGRPREFLQLACEQRAII